MKTGAIIFLNYADTFSWTPERESWKNKWAAYIAMHMYPGDIY